ncbi:MAG: hypothetical protein LBH64_02455, partial [Coriobacteriales bacterium]|nr:hypothetical protein [Coriobacteriales bacterium]
MQKPVEKIIIPSGANVWPHELKAAQALAAIGLTVEFIRRSERERELSIQLHKSKAIKRILFVNRHGI